MRIAHVKDNTNRSYSTDYIDRINNREECLNCSCPRTVLQRVDNPYTIMRVCTNYKCFLYNNITKLQSWIEQNK